MSKVLITGGCGFIGSHTLVSLLENGYEVLILDSNLNSSAKVIKKILHILELKNLNLSDKLRFFKGDVRDNLILEKIFLDSDNKISKIDGVIHFSGLKSVSYSKKSPLEYWDVNILGTINLMKVMDKYNCRKLIFSSSASIYGNSQKFLSLIHI